MMRATIVCALVLFGVSDATRIQKLIRKEESERTYSQIGVFGLKDYKSDNCVSLFLNTDGKSVKLSKKEQVSTWYDMWDQKSSLFQEGYKFWSPLPGGFVFRDTHGSAKATLPDLFCKAEAGKKVDGGKIAKLDFECSVVDDKEKEKSVGLAQADAKYVSYNNYVDPSYWYGGDFDNGHFWNDCSSGSPYGWNSAWGDWSYPYYAITDRGYYGCSSLGTDGYCGVDPYFFRYDVQPHV
jgi:hypothetical protein